MIGQDLLVGAPAIAAELHMPVKQIYRLHESEGLPTFKMGGQLCARRSQLDAALRATIESIRSQEGTEAMTESELREDMAPRIAAKLLARHRPTGWTIQEAQELAFEIIAMVQAAIMQAAAGVNARKGEQ